MGLPNDTPYVYLLSLKPCGGGLCIVSPPLRMESYEGCRLQHSPCPKSSQNIGVKRSLHFGWKTGRHDLGTTRGTSSSSVRRERERREKMETTSLVVLKAGWSENSFLPNLVQVRFVLLATKRIPSWALSWPCPLHHLTPFPDSGLCILPTWLI